MTVETARLEELLSNPLWRLENLYWIVDDHGDVVKFKLRPVQRDYLQAMWSRNLVPKSRQHGISTGLCIMNTDECIFVPNTTAATICDTKDNASKMFRSKVKFPWDRLPKEIKDGVGIKNETAEEIVWGNGSSYAVTTSARSGTLQILHVSEFGKICAKYPEKAAEIVSGSLPAVVQTGKIHIESTAEGMDGKFYEFVMAAKQNQDAGKPLTILDWKLHFFPWWTKPLNVLDSSVVIPQKFQKYFEKLKSDHGIVTSPSQQAWYVKTQETLGDLMWREHPSFLEEAFAASVEGAILQEQMAQIRNLDRIGQFRYDPRFEVNTFWDFGLTRTSGQTVILYHQRINGMNRFINCDFGINLSISQLVNALNSKPYAYGKHYMPHDVAKREQGLFANKSRQEHFNDLGVFNIQKIDRIPTLSTGIQMLQSFLLTCEFDEEGCIDLIKGLDSYRREWDEKAGKFKEVPLHNWASDFADALRQAAQGYEPNVEHYTHQHGAYQPVPDEILEPEVGY